MIGMDDSHHQRVDTRVDAAPDGVAPTAPAEQSRLTRVEIVVPVRTLLAIAGFAAMAAVVIVVRGLLLSIVVAAVLSLGLDPLVNALVGRGWQRGRAALCVFAFLLALTALVVTATVNPLWSEVRAFARHLPGYWNELARNPTLKPLLSHLSERSVDSDLSTWPRSCPERRAPSLASRAARSPRCYRS
jgi:predicted PurR-regulated permease PerM